METYLPLIALVVGFALNEAAQVWRERRTNSAERRHRWEDFIAKTLGDVLVELDEAYEAAALIGLNADVYGVDVRTDDPDIWKVREAAVVAVGRKSFRLRSIAALFPRDESPGREIEAMADAVGGMGNRGRRDELLERWRAVDPAMLPARDAVAEELRSLLAVP
jgi:hypothetical protein